MFVKYNALTRHIFKNRPILKPSTLGNGFSLSEIRPDDIVEIFRMTRSHINYYSFQLHYLAKLYKNNQARILVVKYNKKILGFLIGYLKLSMRGPIGDIVLIITDKDYRRKGLATSLISSIFDWFRYNKCNKCYLKVKSDNEIAILLYKKHGFSKMGEVKRFYSDGCNADVMIKSLPKIQ
jgi:ribosomal-protein-alanine N-acetyltransferase